MENHTRTSGTLLLFFQRELFALDAVQFNNVSEWATGGWFYKIAVLRDVSTRGVGLRGTARGASGGKLPAAERVCVWSRHGRENREETEESRSYFSQSLFVSILSMHTLKVAYARVKISQALIIWKKNRNLRCTIKKVQ